jgi:pre-mRNA-splicing helicase BRR2
LVLQADVRLIEKVKRDDATGEVMSLSGKLLGTRMGDKAMRSRPAKTEERKAKRQKRDETTSSMHKLKGRGGGGLFDDEYIAGDFGGGAILYRPKTQETKQTYEVLLSYIQNAIGDQVIIYKIKRRNELKLEFKIKYNSF